MCWHRRISRMVLVVKINSAEVRASIGTAKPDSLLCLYLILRGESLEGRCGQLDFSVSSSQ